MTIATEQSDSLITRLGQWVEGRRAQNFITALIVLNAITLGLETDGNFTGAPKVFLRYFDDFVLAVFSIEILLKLLYRRLSFLKNGWNVFDFVIVSIALMPDSGSLSVLRALRIFRALRLLSVVPSMRKVAQALISAIPGIMSVGSIILLIFYIFAVLATNFFGNAFPDWFGNIGKSMFTLLQILTLDSWARGIVRPLMEVHSWAWVFFVPFILITSFAVLNLFIGIIVDAMQSQSAEEHQALRDENVEIMSESSEIHQELGALREDVKTLKALLESRSS